METLQGVDSIVLAHTQNFGEFGVKVVEEQRVDNLVDIFGRSVMHTACAAFVATDDGFKHCAENRRADFAPVEFVGAVCGAD